jgi:hypothetical protein
VEAFFSLLFLSLSFSKLLFLPLQPTSALTEEEEEQARKERKCGVYMRAWVEMISTRVPSPSQ